MKNIFCLIVITIFMTFPMSSIGQPKSQCEQEEIIVINQLLDKLIDLERLHSVVGSDSSFILFFQTNLSSDFNHDQRLKAKYKTNKLLKILENNSLSQRTIDSLKINRIDNVKMVFKYKSEYLLDEYDSRKVIGEFMTSRISFNKYLNKGYFYYQVYCGEDCGWGDLLMIKKKKGKWVIKKYVTSWVA